MIYSFSRLNLYATCPFRFRLKYLEGFKEPITKPLALGKAVHKAIETIIQGESTSEAVLKGWAEADFHEEVSKDEITELVERAPVYENMGQTEMYFKLPLSESPSAPLIQGYIDLVIENGGKIIDWKTNQRMYDVHDNHQVGLYAWAMSQLTQKEMVKGSLYFLRFNKEKKYFFRLEDMERARQWAYELASEIESSLFIMDIMPERKDEIFPAKPSGACSHCPFAITCYKKFGQY